MFEFFLRQTLKMDSRYLKKLQAETGINQLSDQNINHVSACLPHSSNSLRQPVNRTLSNKKA